MRSLFIKVIVVLLLLLAAAQYWLVNSQQELAAGPNLLANTAMHDGFTPVVRDAVLDFPADEGVHPDFRNEWWYFTANLKDQQGQDWGVQWTLFRFAATQGDLDGWQSPHRYMAHWVITKPDGQIAHERFARAGIGQANVQVSPFAMWIDDWQWQGGESEPFPATLIARQGDAAMNLSITNQGVRVLHGEQGYSQKNQEDSLASYYFSYPSLAVSGVITLNGVEHQLRGNGWYDREWSSNSLIPDEFGWDWMSLHLDDNRKLMVSQVRQGDQRYYFGTLMDGETVTSLSSQDIQMQVTRNANLKQGVYPLGWHVIIAEHNIDIKVDAIKQLKPLPLTFSYWEAPVKVSGSATGRGYMELTGY
uniref:lipocalin-like domain-containing protein n=1 Tax=Thaumasiovibrio occultus TaxID=1891184 RepID=UPI000B35F5DC|nr:lipocalin-like domain-containing protein [Thaumasiovibrio occultus]